MQQRQPAAVLALVHLHVEDLVVVRERHHSHHDRARVLALVLLQQLVLVRRDRRALLHALPLLLARLTLLPLLHALLLPALNMAIRVVIGPALLDILIRPRAARLQADHPHPPVVEGDFLLDQVEDNFGVESVVVEEVGLVEGPVVGLPDYLVELGEAAVEFVLESGRLRAVVNDEMMRMPDIRVHDLKISISRHLNGLIPSLIIKRVEFLSPLRRSDEMNHRIVPEIPQDIRVPALLVHDHLPLLI